MPTEHVAYDFHPEADTERNILTVDHQVGTFDPYSDDPRLAIQKTWLCALSETLVVAGTAGQVILLQMEREARTQELQAFTINIVSERDSFVWKGHEALTPMVGDVRFPAGYQPTCIVQLYPPAACTALVLHSEWQLWVMYFGALVTFSHG